MPESPAQCAPAWDVRVWLAFWDCISCPTGTIRGLILAPVLSPEWVRNTEVLQSVASLALLEAKSSQSK
eukprot:gene4673-4863_t